MSKTLDETLESHKPWARAGNRAGGLLLSDRLLLLWPQGTCRQSQAVAARACQTPQEGFRGGQERSQLQVLQPTAASCCCRLLLLVLLLLVALLVLVLIDAVLKGAGLWRLGTCGVHVAVC